MRDTLRYAALPNAGRLALLALFAALIFTEAAIFVYDAFVPGHTIILEEESGFIPWLNGGVTGAAAACAMLAFVVGMRAQPARRHMLWLAAALALAWFATDDIMAIHERVGRDAMNGLVRTFYPGDVDLHNAVWIILFGPVFAATGLVLLALAGDLGREDRRLRLWVLLALGMWGMALALEAVGSSALSGIDGARSGSIIAEETLEIAGATVLLGVFFVHASTLAGRRNGGFP